ncbi:MAG: sigma-70 family RNA polymerase sigma factor [Anaerolineales bacterium]|nr:sigma-70 family RNA polymerase sigma factor [Anaerolineales bacterium]
MVKNTEQDTSAPNLSCKDLQQAVKEARIDPGAFGDLYRLSVERVYRYLYSRTGNTADAEDLTAQTFLSAFEALPGLRQNDRFVSWLFSIARNKLKDYYRRRKPQTTLDAAESAVEDHNPLAAVIRSEQNARLDELIGSLPEQEQELLRLRFLAEMRFSEMGRLLHRSGDTVKKQVYRLLSRLQEQMEVSHE